MCERKAKLPVGTRGGAAARVRQACFGFLAAGLLAVPACADDLCAQFAAKCEQCAATPDFREQDCDPFDAPACEQMAAESSAAWRAKAREALDAECAQFNRFF